MKLFSSLYQGTLRGRSDEILVFTNLLAYADQHGIVDKHFKAIADETGLSVERVQAAILALESPDQESRSPEMNGCRIVRVDDHRVWGWRVVNYGKYRAIRNEDDRREQNRLAQERWRNKQNSKQNKPPSSQAEAEAEVEVKDLSGKPDLPGFTLFWKTWPKGERKQGKSKCLAIWKRKALEAKADFIVAHVEKLKLSDSWRRGFDPMPTTYLNEERWDGADMGEPALRVAL